MKSAYRQWQQQPLETRSLTASPRRLWRGFSCAWRCPSPHSDYESEADGFKEWVNKHMADGYHTAHTHSLFSITQCWHNFRLDYLTRVSWRSNKADKCMIRHVGCHISQCSAQDSGQKNRPLWKSLHNEIQTEQHISEVLLIIAQVTQFAVVNLVQRQAAY